MQLSNPLPGREITFANKLYKESENYFKKGSGFFQWIINPFNYGWNRFTYISIGLDGEFKWLR